MKLYKYYSFDKNDHSINGLKNHEFFLSDPLKFSNPVEADPRLLQIEFEDKKNLEEARDHYFRKAKPSLWEQLDEMPLDQLGQLMKNKCKGTVRKELKKCGLSCYSENDLSNEMWDAYSANHSGFVLEFDKKHEYFNTCYKVDYSDDNPLLTGAMIGNTDPTAPQLVSSIFLRKAKKWAHEKEWRKIHDEKSETLEYDPEMLTGVILGKDCNKKDEQKIIKILQEDALKHVKLFKIEMSSSSKLSKKKYT